MKESPGRKAKVLVGDGFSLDELQGSPLAGLVAGPGEKSSSFWDSRDPCCKWKVVGVHN